MSEQRFEYRLRWQRIGRRAATQIMQSEKGAVEKAERLLALDEVKGTDELERLYGSMPDLTVMTLERRPVGDWEQVRVFDVPEPDPESAAVEGDPNAGLAPW